MKKILIVLTLVASYLFSQGTQLKLYDYQLNVNGLVKLKTGKIGFALLKPVKNSKDENAFGYWLSNNTNANSVFLEIKDGSKNLASITAKDFNAKAKLSSGNVSTASYKAGSGANAVEVVIESSIQNNESMPLAKAISVNVKAKTQGNKNLTAVLNLYGDGYVTKVGTSGVSNSRVEKGIAEYPVVVLTANSGTTLSLDGPEQKAPGRIVKLTSGQVQASGSEITLLSFNVNGSTVKNYEKSVKQASNIEAAVRSKKEETELATVITADNQKPFPRDTVTYTIYYNNIGTAFAQDVEISNPVPENMMYVEGSAKGDNANVSLDRTQATAPQQGAVINVRWKLNKKILPGEEGSVTMKAIVR